LIFFFRGDVTGFEASRAQISMVHDISGIKVSEHKARELDQETSSRLHSDQKLSLILDLDQTLIHATADPAVGVWMDQHKNDSEARSSFPALHRFKLPGDPHEYFLRLRPFLEEFMEGVAKLFELHIYTMGSRMYAAQVAAIIDPEKNYFQERILSRDESGSTCVLGF
jgi:RNA polymerase II subunit A-like phosphatase